MEDEYDRRHAVTPVALDDALRSGGARSYRIWRSGRDVFQLIEADDLAELFRISGQDPISEVWNARMADLFEGGSVGPLPLIWELPEPS